MNGGTKEKLALSLTAESVDLIPYLPYLLQDLWEIGSSPEDIISLIKQNIRETNDLKVLDLACGKGAVSVVMAKELGAKVKGIDLIPEFIEYAEKKCEEYGVRGYCSFAVGNVNLSVEKERNYDIVVFGAAGGILGSPAETLQKLKQTLKPGGFIIIDEAYLNDSASNDGVKYRSYEYLTRAQWAEIFKKLDLSLAGELAADSEKLAKTNDSDISFIKKRAKELAEKYPEKKRLFTGYVESQQNEVCDLTENITGVTWMLRKERVQNLKIL